MFLHLRVGNSMNRAESSHIRMWGESSAPGPPDQGVALVSTLASGRPDRSDLGREYITGKTFMLSDSMKGLAFVFRWCHQPSFPPDSCVQVLQGQALLSVPNWIFTLCPPRALMMKVIDFISSDQIIQFSFAHEGAHQIGPSNTQL